MFLDGFDKHIYVERFLKEIICSAYIYELACIRKSREYDDGDMSCRLIAL